MIKLGHIYKYGRGALVPFKRRGDTYVCFMLKTTLDFVSTGVRWTGEIEDLTEIGVASINLIEMAHFSAYGTRYEEQEGKEFVYDS